MNIKAILGLGLISMAVVANAQDAQLHWIDKLQDVSLYLKPKYDLVNQWDQEFGVMARIVHSGNFVGTANADYDPIYPIRFNIEPRYSAGFQFLYNFTRLPTVIGIYTKPKYNFVNNWKEENGLTARLFTSPRLIISSNIAYQWNYPYIAGQKPNWLGLVCFQFPL